MVNIINKKFAFVILIVFLFANFCSASFSIGNASDAISTSYSSGGVIRGWINISLDKENPNSVLESSFGEKINLRDLIKKPSNLGFNYTCTPSACTSNYLASEEETSKTFDLTENGTVPLWGMKITEPKKITEVYNFHFDLSSTNPETEKLPLMIDVLNDGQIEWRAYNASATFGEEDFGCFTGEATAPKYISITPYCEKITFSTTPEIELGAYVTYKEGTKNIAFTMSIQKINSSSSKTCQTTSATGSGQVERVACTPDYSINENGDYLVCIKKSSSDYNYQISSEESSPCGFAGTYEGEYDYDFEIFARAKKYSELISITINNSELETANSPVSNIENYIEEYLLKNYNNDCSGGCIIPIKIYSGTAQEITISNAEIEYAAGTSEETTSLYGITETSAEISSSYKKLFFDEAGFRAPTTSGEHNLSIKLNGNNLISKKINVEKVVEISLIPTSTAIKFPTKFIADVSAGNITEYKWDFGDGSAVQTTSKNEITHAYNSSGTYSLNITVKDNRGGISARGFSITVAKASEIVPLILSGANSYFASIDEQMGNFSEFEQDSIDDTLNLSSIGGTINKLNDAVLTAVSESDYEKILTELLSINLPIAIAKTTTGTGMIFYPTTSKINLDLLKEIGGGDYTTGKEKEYKDAILAWHNDNIEGSLAYSEISLMYEDIEKSLKIFEIHIAKKGTDQAYIVIKNMENLFLQNKGGYTEKDGYFYTALNGEKDIRFSTTEEIDFTNLPIFISPSLENLVIIEITSPAKPNWTLPIMIAVIIILIALTVWAILQIWYIRKYEGYLFRDRNHLYNIINYISDAKKKGEKNNDISARLRKAGWNSEQVAYALKKYERKNTGLPEIIPIRKLLGGPKKISPATKPTI